MEYIEYICPIVCFVVCILHSIIQSIFSKIQGKKIDKLCEKCGLPVYDGFSHDCSLSVEQLQKLFEFVSSLKGDNHGNES